MKVRCHHRGRYGGIVAESTGADNDILRIGVDIRNGSEIDVETVFFQVVSDIGARMPGRFGIALQGRHAFDIVKAEVRVPGHAGDAAAFLVHRHQRFSPQGMERGGQRFQLGGIVNVVSIQEHPADGILLRRRSHGLGYASYLILRKFRRFVPDDRRIQAFQPDDKQLADLFPEGHFLQGPGDNAFLIPASGNRQQERQGGGHKQSFMHWPRCI